jgi:phosphohistidine phosphatase SixA
MRLLVVRHASAGNRARWEADDRLRPLDDRGRQQAEGLVELLRPFPLERLLSSPFFRCAQTFEPLAIARDLSVELREELAEGEGIDAFRDLADELDAPAALCVHGDVLKELVRRGEPREKGSTWIVERQNGELRPERYLPPPA